MGALLPLAAQRLCHDVSVRDRLKGCESVVLGFALVYLVASGLQGYVAGQAQRSFGCTLDRIKFTSTRCSYRLIFSVR